MIVETETDEVMISEETLNDDPDFQSNSNVTMPNPTRCHPDDLDLTDDNFIAVCKEYIKPSKYLRMVSILLRKKQEGNLATQIGFNTDMED